MSHLNVTKLTKTVGAKTLFKDVEFSLYPGERAGLIGVNGTGKSTLMSILAGDVEADSVNMDHPKKYEITYLKQEPEFDESLTVLETVFSGDSPILALNRSYEQALKNMMVDSSSTQLQEELMNIQEGMEQENAWDINALAKTALTKLGIDMFDQPVGELSGGQKKRVALAKALIEPADLILLDEPTNHLDALSTEWLQETLLRMNSAMLFVTHDRYFLDAVSTHIFELADQTMYTHKGNYGDYLENKAIRDEMAASSQQKLENRFRSELKWIRRGAKARSTKQKARIQRFEEIQENVQKENDNTSLELSMQSQRLGKKIIEGENLGMAFGDNVIFRNFDFLLQGGDRIGIVGPNGAGKSTLMKLIAGDYEPTEGRLEYGSTVKIAHFTQHLPEMNEAQRMIEYIQEISSDYEAAKGVRLSATQMLERFLFPSNAHGTQIGKLSGGERKRLYLLKLLMEQPNILLLDEPTNDLDIQTLSVLEDFLENFPGVVITISHDRFFLDRIARKLWTTGTGEVLEYQGLYSDFIKEKPVPAAKATAEPMAEPIKETPKPEKPKKKMTFKEQQEYKTILDDIAEVESRIEEREGEMAKAGADFEKLNKLTEEVDELTEQYDTLIDRWTYLQEIAES
ncbi:ABC-F family ATP-binding cassette domain-containing protein [Planococcus glaciei]|uniref:ABC-F family ATP-binding cassette domain-containing protein n=1 Tax=Planococcus glaciei TaxID=459472 RepID=A0A1G7ZXL9_9BACL|nr:ABC-F family ATP-binding cassette domain-containing protein [Planococcus glaciei]ETP70027.1 multidrug ABC transporter ATP-binding protein [Planococcus glaciei CHR43]MBX0313975.1 ABC-F family ATP-binding cassette domain-containing protein [Planococcus glaciei]QKX52342.1 ABC-F family ATP-binding cassette domain-containing protein [Planococcus glaciei]SDH13393.1 ATP-binding cassette, subfamily F, uup [Planococcus glaciei]